jgi:hypothetical protein
MKPILFCKQLFHRLAVHLVGDATVYRTDGCTLRLFVEALAFGAFIRNDIIGVYADRWVTVVGVNDRTVKQGKRPFYITAVSDGPFHTAFIDGVIGAFRFAGAAVDAFFRYLNSHFLRIRE